MQEPIKKLTDQQITERFTTIEPKLQNAIDNLSYVKKPSWLRSKIWYLKELWWTLTKARYFIERYQVQQVAGKTFYEIVWSKYMHFNVNNHEITWTDKPTQYYKPITAIMTIRNLRRKHPEFEHMLIEMNQYNWVNATVSGPNDISAVI